MYVQMPAADITLLKKIAEGDQPAFKTLFDLYRPNVYTTALRITGDEWIAEEILQDTFLKVWLKRDTLPAIDNFGGWLYTIARNYTLNAIKRIHQEKTQFLKLHHESWSGEYEPADRRIEDRTLQSILTQAIDRLPEKQKQTYILIKQQDMKRDEVARQLHVSPETVKWNLEQAMKSIRAFCMAQMKDMPVVLLACFISKYF